MSSVVYQRRIGEGEPPSYAVIISSKPYSKSRRYIEIWRFFIWTSALFIETIGIALAMRRAHLGTDTGAIAIARRVPIRSRCQQSGGTALYIQSTTTNTPPEERMQSAAWLKENSDELTSQRPFEYMYSVCQRRSLLIVRSSRVWGCACCCKLLANVPKTIYRHSTSIKWMIKWEYRNYWVIRYTWKWKPLCRRWTTFILPCSWHTCGNWHVRINTEHKYCCNGVSIAQMWETRPSIIYVRCWPQSDYQCKQSTTC